MSKSPIPNPPRRETLLVKNGNTTDIIKSLMKVADMDYQAAQVAAFAQQFKGSNPDDQYSKLKELWKYTRKEIQYEEDPEGKQLIKDPARVFWDNQKGDGTDCKSLSLFEYSVCRAIGVPCYFEFVSFFSKREDSGQRITHVYPVAIVPGIGEVVLDAVYTKFDERPPGITRLVKKYTKVYHQMADISHIAGFRIGKAATPTTKDLASEANQRAKLVKPLGFVDYTVMSEGEMATYLIAQRDKMLSEYYQGTPQGAAYAQAFSEKKDALYRGLHRGFNLFGGVKSNTRSASGWLTLPEKGVNLKKGFNFLFDDAESGAERVGVIPQLDCDFLFPFINPADHPGQNWVDGANQTIAANRQKCAIDNLWRKELNKEWPSNGPVLIYEFLTDSMIPNNLDGESVRLLGGKIKVHTYFVDVVTSGSKISRGLLDTWLVNGCIEKSIAGADGKSLGPQTPVDYIDGLKRGGAEGIGFFQGALAIAIPIAIGVMILNYKGFKRLVDVINGNQTLKQAVQGQAKAILQFVKDNASQVAALAGVEDFQPDLGGSGGGDIPIPPGGGGGNRSGGTGLFANLSQNEKIGLGVAAAVVLYGATSK